MEIVFLPDVDLRINGRLDESAWHRASVIREWRQLAPNEGEPPSLGTEMRVFHDGKAVYLGARLSTGPGFAPVVRSLERDSYTPDQDAVALILDTLNDNRTAFGFIVTPAGVRTDIAIFDDAETGSQPWNTDWNAFWDAATSRGPDAWTAEIRIPFSSLRFNSTGGRVEMGMILWRYIAENVETDIFPAVPNDWSLSAYKPSRALDVRLNNVRERHPIYIRPYFLGGAEQGGAAPSDSPAGNSDLRAGAGLDLKVNLSSHHVLDATLHPDFAQVEADDQRINLTRFSLFFPEKRPFFQERADLFDVRIPVGNQKLFHSRSIGIREGRPVPILGGVRLTGRSGDWQIGFLEMQTARTELGLQEIASENFGVLRIKREIKRDGSFMGGMVTSRADFRGGYNLVTALDMDVSLKAPHAYVKLRLAGSAEPGVVYKKSLMGALTLESRIQRGFSYAVVARHIGRDFHPGLGYLSRGGVNLLYNRLEYTWFPAVDSAVQNHGFKNKLIGIWNSDNGVFETLDDTLTWHALLRTGASLQADVKWMHEHLVRAFSVGKVVIEPDRYRFGWLEADYRSPSGFPLQWGIKGIGGGYFGGRRLGGEFSAAWTLSSHWMMTGEYIHNFVEIDRKTYRPHVARFRLRTALNRSLSAGALIQYSSDLGRFSSNIRIRFNPSEGVDLYIVYNEGIAAAEDGSLPDLFQPRERSLLIKFNYTFVL